MIRICARLLEQIARRVHQRRALHDKRPARSPRDGDGVKGGRLVWRLVGRSDRNQFLQKLVAVPCRRSELPVGDRKAMAHQMLSRAVHSDDQAHIVQQYCGAIDMIQARHDSRSRGRSDASERREARWM